jgi:integrase
VALVVKRRAEGAGLDPKLVSKMTVHSLRSGYATAAAAAGIEERKIVNVTRHKNLDVLRGYIGRRSRSTTSAGFCDRACTALSSVNRGQPGAA